jgi:hypothetical protein
LWELPRASWEFFHILVTSGLPHRPHLLKISLLFSTTTLQSHELIREHKLHPSCSRGPEFSRHTGITPPGPTSSQALQLRSLLLAPMLAFLIHSQRMLDLASTQGPHAWRVGEFLGLS